VINKELNLERPIVTKTMRDTWLSLAENLRTNTDGACWIDDNTRKRAVGHKIEGVTESYTDADRRAVDQANEWVSSLFWVKAPKEIAVAKPVTKVKAPIPTLQVSLF
jgi:hypothetical protein